MEEILQTEELSLQYGGVAPVHRSVLTGLGDVTARELKKKTSLNKQRRIFVDRIRFLGFFPRPNNGFLEYIAMQRVRQYHLMLFMLRGQY